MKNQTKLGEKLARFVPVDDTNKILQGIGVFPVWSVVFLL